ncbi:MAG TPA: septal ring lytic transglycosylase RlpA family protein [Candidatus Paceibacterota bacterium]|nr:septal ring lytic transglycosylase RlpA family protein [Candidatus Paceibacterota bacterium]
MSPFKLPIVLSLVLSTFAPIAHADAKPTLATWYATCRHGPLCVASWEYDIGTKLSLRNLETGKSAVGVVLDRGPEKWTGKKLDVSLPIARELGMVSAGVAVIDVQVIGRP